MSNLIFITPWNSMNRPVFSNFESSPSSLRPGADGQPELTLHRSMGKQKGRYDRKPADCRCPGEDSQSCVLSPLQTNKSHDQHGHKHRDHLSTTPYIITYILNEDTQPVIRAIGVSHTACKDEFRQNIRSHSWSVSSFFIII